MSDDQKIDGSKTMLIDIPPDIFQKMQTGRVISPSTLRSRNAARRKHPPVRQIRLRDKGSTVTIRNIDLQELFQGVYDAGFITDLHGDILDANVRATQFFLYTKAQFRELTVGEVVMGFNETVTQTILENLKEDKFTLIMAQCLRQDGTHFPAEISTSRLCLSRKDYLCFFIRDITSRREAEESLRQAHHDLEKEVEERTRINQELTAEVAERTRAQNELNAAIEKLKEHDRAKSQFVSNVSHELKTPLTSIMYVASNMLKGVVGAVPDGARTYLEMIQADCRRLNRTVSDILDMSRIEANTLALNLVKIPFGKLVRRSTDSLKVQAESEALTMQVTTGSSKAFVSCDPQKMERVVYNLVKNAIKFNVHEGRIEVAVYPDPDQASWVAMDILDTGMGVEPQHLSRIMERFFRVGEYVSGTGLGLPIAKELVERHGGTLEVFSPPPNTARGFLARVRFPACSPPNVLIVYRDPSLRFQTTQILANEGYRIASAMNGGDAIPALHRENPDLIVLDWLSSGLEDGLLLARLRHDPLLTATPVVAIVDQQPEQTKLDILEGFDVQHVMCPWDDKAILDAVYAVTVSRKRIERQGLSTDKKRM